MGDKKVLWAADANGKCHAKCPAATKKGNLIRCKIAAGLFGDFVKKINCWTAGKPCPFSVLVSGSSLAVRVDVSEANIACDAELRLKLETRVEALEGADEKTRNDRVVRIEYRDGRTDAQDPPIPHEDCVAMFHEHYCAPLEMRCSGVGYDVFDAKGVAVAHTAHVRTARTLMAVHAYVQSRVDAQRRERANPAQDPQATEPAPSVPPASRDREETMRGQAAPPAPAGEVLPEIDYRMALEALRDVPHAKRRSFDSLRAHDAALRAQLEKARTTIERGFGPECNLAAIRESERAEKAERERNEARDHVTALEVAKDTLEAEIAALHAQLATCVQDYAEAKRERNEARTKAVCAESDASDLRAGYGALQRQLRVVCGTLAAVLAARIRLVGGQDTAGNQLNCESTVEKMLGIAGHVALVAKAKEDSRESLWYSVPAPRTTAACTVAYDWERKRYLITALSDGKVERALAPSPALDRPGVMCLPRDGKPFLVKKGFVYEMVFDFDKDGNGTTFFVDVEHPVSFPKQPQ